MKGFLVLLVLSAAGLAGVLYWRKSLEAPKAPAVTAAAPAKAGKQKQRRRRHGARRLSRNEILARNDIFVGSSDDAPPAYDTAQAYAQKPRSREPEPERAPLAPGGASTTEVPPDDVFGELTPPSSAAQAPSGGGRQAPEPEPIKLRASDLKIVWQGEDLSKAETQHLDLSNEGGHDLTEAEIDARFRTKEDAVLGCINRARPDEYTDIPGRVTVRFRIQRTGAVKGVQVEAPVILHKGGLLGCMRGVVGGLKFPASSGSQVISYPYSLM